MADIEFRVARIVYLPDVTRADGPVIPIGVFAEVLTQHRRGLALKARTSFSAAELEEISPLLREALTNPFKYLRNEFDDAWDKAPPGRALEYLAKRHISSLSVLAPTDSVKHKGWLSNLHIPPRREALEAKLMAAADEEYDKLWPEDGSQNERTILELERAS